MFAPITPRGLGNSSPTTYGAGPAPGPRRIGGRHSASNRLGEHFTKIPIPATIKPMLSAVPSSLAWAHPLVREWFVSRFGTPTEPQEQGWPHILAGHTTLISAPTGSGKTLAAFLACIDGLVRKALAGQLH